MKYFYLLVFLLCLAVSCSKPSSVQELKDQNKVENAYYLYGSTLRMLNIQDVESYDKLVRDVEKLSLMKMRPDSFGYKEVLAFSNRLQKEEGYDVYLEVEDTERQYYILGKESPNKTMILVNQESSQYIVDIAGRPNFLEMPRLIDSFSEMDSMETSGFSMLFDRINEDAAREERRRKRWQKGAEERKRKQEEMEQKKDSIARDSANLKIEPVLD